MADFKQIIKTNFSEKRNNDITMNQIQNNVQNYVQNKPGIRKVKDKDSNHNMKAINRGSHAGKKKHVFLNRPPVHFFRYLIGDCHH
jgi:hypothetical protein